MFDPNADEKRARSLIQTATTGPSDAMSDLNEWPLTKTLWKSKY